MSFFSIANEVLDAQKDEFVGQALDAIRADADELLEKLDKADIVDLLLAQFGPAHIGADVNAKGKAAEAFLAKAVPDAFELVLEEQWECAQ